MNPTEKMRKIQKIIDTYTEWMKKVTSGGRIDKTVAKQLGIPEELLPILENAYKKGTINATTKNSLALKELKNKIQSMEYKETPMFSLDKTIAEETMSNTLARSSGKISNAVIEQLKREFKVVENIFGDESIPRNKMESMLRKITGDGLQDWDMVIRTELVNSRNKGFADEVLRGESPYSNDREETIVFKRPSPNACKHCKKHYLERDGITPKLFKLSELMENGTNYGKKVADWKPVLGVMHPHCECELQVMPKGCEFVDGQITIKKGGKNEKK